MPGWLTLDKSHNLSGLGLPLDHDGKSRTKCLCGNRPDPTKTPEWDLLLSPVRSLLQPPLSPSPPPTPLLNAELNRYLRLSSAMEPSLMSWPLHSPPAKAGLLKPAMGKNHVGLSSPWHLGLLCMTTMQPVPHDSSAELDNI